MDAVRTNVVVDVQEDGNAWIYQLDKSLEDEEAWVNRLNKRVAETEWQDPYCTIFRVPYKLRVVDPIAYEPRILSLGPYHHGKPHLKAMEELKWRYLKIFLDRNPQRGLKDYIKLVEKMETRTRKAYSEAPHMDRKHWVEMMLLDGCFVLEFFVSRIHPIKNSACVHTNVLLDMLLLENQLPFFFLVELSKLHSFYSQDSCLLPQITLNTFKEIMPGYIQLSFCPRIDHILHLLYSCMLQECHISRSLRTRMRRFSIIHRLWKQLCPKRRLGRLRMRRFSIVHRQWKKLCPKRLLDRLRMRRFSIVHRLWKKLCPERLLDRLRMKIFSIVHRLWKKLWKFKEINDSSFIWAPSAKNLKDAGVVFQKKTKNIRSFMDITFRRGKLEIPQLHIDDSSDSLFRNLLAFEQCRIGYVDQTNLAAYAYLMDCIINTPADVDVLQQNGIIVNLLGNDDDIAQLFNQLCKNVSLGHKDYLNGVFTKIQRHCNKRENKWKASLNHNYFNNPWATVSIVAAFFLFLLTITQTVFAVLSYVRPRSP